MYVIADKILSIILNYLGWIKIVKSAVMTGGLVQEEIFSVLPTPKPITTFVLTFVGMLVSLDLISIQNEIFIIQNKTLFNNEMYF